MSPTNDEIQTVSPNIWRHGWGKPSLHQLHRETSRRRAKMKKVFLEQNINTYKSRNSTGVHKYRRRKDKQSSKAWRGGGRQSRATSSSPKWRLLARGAWRCRCRRTAQESSAKVIHRHRFLKRERFLLSCSEILYGSSGGGGEL